MRERLKPNELCETETKHQLSIIRLETRVKKEEKVSKLEKYQHKEKKKKWLPNGGNPYSEKAFYNGAFSKGEKFLEFGASKLIFCFLRRDRER